MNKQTKPNRLLNTEKITDGCQRGDDRRMAQIDKGD